MITFDKALCNEIEDFVHSCHDDKEAAWDLSTDIYGVLWSIEREDERNGTNELGALLETKSIASIAKEYGLVGEGLTHEQGLGSL